MSQKCSHHSKYRGFFTIVLPIEVTYTCTGEERQEADPAHPSVLPVSTVSWVCPPECSCRPTIHRRLISRAAHSGCRWNTLKADRDMLRLCTKTLVFPRL